jgi:hypothetical protein
MMQAAASKDGQAATTRYAHGRPNEREDDDRTESAYKAAKLAKDAPVLGPTSTG